MATYLQKLSSLLDIDGDTAKKLLDDSTMAELVDLSAAVNDHDKKSGMDLMHKIQARSNFFIGEPVTINGEKATVVSPDQPGDTVKISRKGAIEMVKKDELEKIDEAVLGMTSIPGLDRIKTLAGIKPQGSVGAGQTNDPENPNNTANNNGQIKSFNKQSDIRKQAEKDAAEKIDVNNLPNDVSKLKQMIVQNSQKANEDMDYMDLSPEDDVTETCLEALQRLEENIDNLRLGDLSEVRNRLLKIYNHLNENMSYIGRKKKN
jgi:hypothetical protein